MFPDFISTADGSFTIYNGQYNDHYHSLGGAVKESMHIYIQCGLMEAIKRFDEIRILDVGFGTGLNALCSFAESEQNLLRIIYTAVEPFPVELNIAEKLNFTDFFENKPTKDVFLEFHKCATERFFEMNEKFQFLKIHRKLQDTELSPKYFNLVYFDPFKPIAHPELWTHEVFYKIYNSMTDDGLLLTYSSSGAVRSALKQAGFVVEKLQGSGKKREISRARKVSGIS